MTSYQLDRAEGMAAKRAGLPFDFNASPGWVIGYGDAILIEPAGDLDSPGDLGADQGLGTGG